jgi:pilus assembly protein CpaF
MERLAEEIVDELTGFGPLEVLLRDPSVTEILVNGPHRVFIERDGVLHQSDLRFIDAHHVERVMQRILAARATPRRVVADGRCTPAGWQSGQRDHPPIALDGRACRFASFARTCSKAVT